MIYKCCTINCSGRGRDCYIRVFRAYTDITIYYFGEALSCISKVEGGLSILPSVPTVIIIVDIKTLKLHCFDTKYCKFNSFAKLKSPQIYNQQSKSHNKL